VLSNQVLYHLNDNPNPNCTNSNQYLATKSLFCFIFYGCWGLISGPHVCRQVLQHLSHSASSSRNIFKVHRYRLHALNSVFWIIGLFLIHLFTCAYIVWSFLPLPPPTLFLQAESVLPLSLILLKRRHKHNKEHKAFC
jgi:hypothetical protein